MDAEAPVTPPRPDAVVNVGIGPLVTVERHHPVEGGVEGPGSHRGNPNLILQAGEYRLLVIFVGYRDDDPGGGGEFRGAVVSDSDLWEETTRSVTSRDINSSHTYKRTVSQRFKEHTNLDKPTGV